MPEFVGVDGKWQGLVRGRVHPPLVFTIIAIFQPALSSRGPEQAAQLSLIMVTEDTQHPPVELLGPMCYFPQERNVARCGARGQDPGTARLGLCRGNGHIDQGLEWGAEALPEPALPRPATLLCVISGPVYPSAGPQFTLCPIG